ncbi:LamG-like jellyroll fold domain-containing protein [Paenibacillus aceris]|nr:LamG-like jellyroll fold domain-containing protein [Paenibacillus aceris]
MRLRWNLSFLLLCCILFGAFATFMIPKQAIAVSACTGPVPVPDLVDFDFTESVIKDKSPRHVDGTAYGNPQLVYEPKLQKNVLKLTGGQFVMIPNAAELNNFPNGFTMLVQFSADILSGEQGIFEKTQSTGYGLEVNPNKMETWDYIGGATRKLYSPVLSANKYYDAAITYDGARHVLYMNGAGLNGIGQVAASENRTGAVTSPTSVGLAIGGDPQSATTAQLTFKGSIGYAKMFSRGLSQSELACYYESTGILADQQGPTWSAGSELTGALIGLTSFNVNWPAATDDKAVTQYRIYKNDTLVNTVNGSTNNYSFDLLIPGETATYKVEAGDAFDNWTTNGPSLTYTMPGTVVAPPGMAPDLLQLTFEHSAGEDGSKAHNNGTPVGNAAVYFNPDFNKNVLALDGNSSYVRIPSNPGLSPSFMTMAASFSLDDLYHTQDIIGKAQHSDYALEFNPITQKLEAWFFIHDITGNDSFVIVPSSTKLTTGQIYDVEATFDGQTAKLYLNGNLEASQSKNGVIGGAAKVDLAIGADAEPTDAQSYFQGKIGFVELYSKVLDASAVQQLHAKYAPAVTLPVSSIGWDIPADWWVGQSAPAVVKKRDTNSVETVIDSGLVFQSLNPNVAVISGTGTITPLRAGTATLTANYGSFSSSVIITVHERELPEPQFLLLNGTSVMAAGETANVVTTIVYEDGSTRLLTTGVTYSSDHPDIAFIDNNGIVHAIAPGTAVLSAVADGLRGDFILTVSPFGEQNGDPQITALQFTGPNSLTVGQLENTVLTAVYSDNSIKRLESGVTYWSENPNVVVIDSVSGAVYAVQPGIARVVAQYQGFNASYSMAVYAVSVPTDPTPPEQRPQELQLSVPSSLHTGQSAAVSAIAVYMNGASETSVSVTSIAQWLVVNPDIVRVDAQGIVTGLRPGTTVVTATYQNLVAQTSITVLEQSIGGNGGYASSGSSGTNSNEDSSMGHSLKIDDLKQQLAVNGTLKVDAIINNFVFPSLAESTSSTQTVSLDRGDIKLSLPGDLFVGSSDRKLILGLSVGSETDQTAWLKTSGSSSNTKLKFASSLFEVTIASQKADGAIIPIPRWAEPIQVEFTAVGDKQLLGVYRIFDDGSMTYIGGELTDKGIRAELHENAKYAVLDYKKAFEDLPEQHWANRTVQIMSAKYIVEGVSDAFFQPEKAITRAEFVALLMKSIHLPQQKQSRFQDVPESAWYAPYVAGAAVSGLVSGEDDTTFRPESVISREEMAVLLARVVEQAGGKSEQSGVESFQDANQMAAWARPSIALTAKLGLLQGRADQWFIPSGSVSRAEAAQALFNLINKMPKK